MLRLLEIANNDCMPFKSDALGVELDVFCRIARKCGFIPIISGEETRFPLLKLRKRGIPLVKLYSRNESNRFNYLDIADIHAGHFDFSTEELEAVLSKYYRNGKPLVDKIFIAGDLFEGLEENEITFESYTQCKSIQAYVNDICLKQVKLLYRVLSKYDFDYIAINGNHEYTFEQLGMESPIALLERMMKKNGSRFAFYDTYLIDFLIGGVIKRMMHLESYCQRDGAVHAYDRLNSFKEHGGLYRIYDGQKYPIRMFQCGHIHRKEELYYSPNKVHISQSGSFIKKEMLYIPAIHMKGIILDDNRILRD